MTKLSTLELKKAEFSNILFVFFIGLLFSVLQFSYFFLLEVYLSSRFISFFVALFCWLVGFLVGINLRQKIPFTLLLLCGVFAYYPAFIMLHLFPYNTYILPFVLVFIGISGTLPGYFFPYATSRFSNVRELFFHENNGFLLGIVICLLCAVFEGRWLLRISPIITLIPVLLILKYQDIKKKKND